MSRREQVDNSKPAVQLSTVREQNFDGAASDRLRRTLLAALRHLPEQFGLRMDAEGWVDLLEVGRVLNSFIGWSQLSNRVSVRLALQHLGLDDRLQFALDYCRSAYGHSTRYFDPKITATPDACPYHGTSADAFRTIDCFGLQPNGRRFVRLTTDFNYANQIARNAGGSPVVLQVVCTSAIESAVKFYPTGTHVWLSSPVPPDCLLKCSE